MPTRRKLVSRGTTLLALMASTGLLPRIARAQSGWNKAAFQARSLDEVARALGVARPVESRDIALTAPDIAENGGVVPLAVSTSLSGVKRIALLIEKNPNALAAVHELSDAVAAQLAMRVKMAESSNVYAVAMLADGRVFYTRKDVKITLGGCGT